MNVARFIIQARFILLSLCTLATTMDLQSAQPADSMDWRWRNPSPQGNNLFGVAWGNNVFVAVGANGTLLTSSDRIVWAERDTGVSTDLTSVSFATGTFLAAGKNGVVLSSSDGMNWTRHDSKVQWDFLASIYGNGQFVLVAQEGVLTSEDAREWIATPRATQFAYSKEIAFGNGRFLMVTGSGLRTSTDGKTWNPAPDPRPYEFLDVAYGNGLFMACGKNGALLSSKDGLSFDQKYDSGTTNHLDSITFANGKFIVTGRDQFLTHLISGERFGRVIWNNPGWFPNRSELTFGDGVYVEVGNNGQINSSRDLENWNAHGAGGNQFINSFARGNGKYVAVGGNLAGNSPIILSSTDGTNWISQSPGAGFLLRSIVFANGRFAAVGDQGTILVSLDGTAWTRKTASTAHRLNSIAFGEGQFCAVGEAGTILTSPDGQMWKGQTSGTSESLYGVVCTNSTFVAVGSKGTVLTSFDGGTWKQRTSFNGQFNAVAYAFGQFIAVGNQGLISTSLDGAVWRSRTSGTTRDLYHVTVHNNQLVALSRRKSLISPDGGTWTDGPYLDQGTLRAAISTENGLIAAGDGVLMFIDNLNQYSYAPFGIHAGDLKEVVSARNSFIAVGQHGLLVSPDGISWNRIHALRTLNSVASSERNIVAVGPEGRIISSPTGSSWTLQASGLTNGLLDISHGKTLVAVGEKEPFSRPITGINGSGVLPRCLLICIR